MGKQMKGNEDQFKNEFLSETNVLVEVKVSENGGETWSRRKISMVSDLDQSGLNAGEIFQLNGERYDVIAKDGELQVSKSKIPVISKQAVRRKIQ